MSSPRKLRFSRCFSFPSSSQSSRGLAAVSEASAPSATANGGASKSEENSMILSAAKANSLGFSFSGGGFLLPYFVGVVKVLQSLGLITDQTHVAGSSAGSLVAASIASGISMDRVSAYAHTLRALYARHQQNVTLLNHHLCIILVRAACRVDCTANCPCVHATLTSAKRRNGD